jgi:ABC-type antimicrobial peptide transport system permease subunit
VYVDGDRCSSLAAVVGDADVTALGEPARPVVYTPMKRLDREATVFLFVRTRSSITAANLSAISGLVKGFVPGASARVELMPDIVRQQSAAARIGVSLTGLLIAIAFLLAACGLYANCEIAVQRRRHELGVRAALGATPARLIATLGSELAIVVAIGSVAGLILGNWMTGLLFFVLTELPIHVRVAQLFAMLVMPMLLLLTSVVPALRLSRCAPRTLMMEAE